MYNYEYVTIVSWGIFCGVIKKYNVAAMQLLTLNIWGGKRYDTLLDWLCAQRETDIVCLQEVFSAQQSPFRTIIQETARISLKKYLSNCLITRGCIPIIS